jgi:hypothetical protein
LNKAQAAAYARAVNLQASDLPAMRVSAPEHEEAATGPEERELALCDGGANPELLVSRIKSAIFTGTVSGEYGQIHSNVEVEPSHSAAALNDTVILSRRGLACLRRFLPRALAKGSNGQQHYRRLTVSRLPTPLPDVRGSFRLRIATTITGGAAVGHAPIPLYVDEVGFVVGAAEVSLTAIAAPLPVPATAEQRLMLLLYRRAHANHL